MFLLGCSFQFHLWVACDTTRLELHFKWYNLHINCLKKSIFLLALFCIASCANYCTHPVFGYSDWIKSIRHLLKSARTSGGIVISEITTHTNDVTRPLYCPLHNIQEERERERHGSSRSHIRNKYRSNLVYQCALACVSTTGGRLC